MDASGLQDPDDRESQLTASPSFKGQLKLADYMHDSEPSPRRSSRLSSGAGSSKSSTPEPAAAGRRKAQPLSSDASRPSGRVTKRKQSAGYAPPSTYAHLSLLPDAIKPNLILLFVGLNPGIQTARSGHAYAHPSNLFWKLLFSSGITPRPCTADEDRDMPGLYSLGFTNIVARPSRNGAELSKQEMDDGVAVLEDKARRWRPECMCIVGKSIWESIWRVRHGGKPVGAQFRYGWQDESENMGAVEGEWAGTRVFVATTTSGLAASMSRAEKEKVWRELGEWVERRRAERKDEGEAGETG